MSPRTPCSPIADPQSSIGWSSRRLGLIRTDEGREILPDRITVGLENSLQPPARLVGRLTVSPATVAVSDEEFGVPVTLPDCGQDAGVKVASGWLVRD